MKVNIKKLVENAVIPSYAKQGDAGMDLTATEVSMNPEFIQYKTGLAIEIPEGFMGLIFPRSSISKYDLALANSVGIIDAGYRGEILCRFKRTFNGNIPDKIFTVGEKVAQLVIIPFPTIELEEVSELSDSERGEGGFGHTGI